VPSPAAEPEPEEEEIIDDEPAGEDEESADEAVIEEEPAEEDPVAEDEPEEPEAEEEEYTTITQDDYFEEEVAAASSIALPYELNFDWNRDDGKERYKPDLDEISRTSLVAQASVIIQGHTDTTGTPEYNNDLSRRRANNVAQVVEASGISREKIIIQAMGETDLKVQTADNVDNEANRRVVVK
jgi:outer membrane protein OmpA-like peptidoglycan-associated protein